MVHCVKKVTDKQVALAREITDIRRHPGHTAGVGYGFVD
jgi:hypothetical protein